MLLARRAALLTALALAACKPSTSEPPAPSAAPDEPAPPSIYELALKRLDGSPAKMEDLKGKVALVVNVASECGYTPQYEGLEKLYEELAPRGFTILAFPSNDFGQQEPGTPEEIAKFAASHYKVQFPLFEKVKTIGPDAAPVYRIASKKLGPPKWNFHKYVVDRRGVVVAAFPSATTPDSPELRAAIEPLLAQK